MSYTNLHDAAKSGDLEKVKHLVEVIGLDPLAKDTGYFGRTPLHYAAISGHQLIVEYLIDSRKCDPNCRGDSGWTPLHCACCNGRQPTVEYLIEKAHCDPNCRNNRGWTPLHYACQWNHSLVVSYLLTMKADPNIATNAGSTPLSLSSKAAIVKELIKFGAKAEIACRRYLPESYNKEPASSVVKTFIFGDPEAGKTTLTEAIKSESSGIISALSGRLFKVLKTNERTAGIVPHQIESCQFGAAVLYDLAGQREFYAAHDALLQSSVPGETAVYLVVADMSKSDEEFRSTLLYWLSFIDNHKSSSKQHVIIVGSHADQVRSKEDRSRKAAIIVSLNVSGSFKSLHFSGFTTVDCRYAESDSMKQLRQKLRQSYKVLRGEVVLHMRTHLFHVYLVEKNVNSLAVTLGSVVTSMETEENKELASYFPHDIDHLVAMCEELSARGNIIFFSNPSNPEDSMVVLDQATLFSRVTGTILAPEGFKQHASLASSTGVVPFSKLASQFPDLDSNMIAQFMCQLEFCHEVSDPEVLQLLQTSSAGTGEERYFFFPGLVRIQAPDRVWEQADRFAYHCGWQLQCTQSEHFLTSRFLQVLILRLAFSFALAPCPAGISSDLALEHNSTDTPTIQRRCSVWKNGIYWANLYGAKALVEVSTDSKRVTLLIRCQKGRVSAATELRSGVIRKILQAKEEFCLAIACHESLLDSSSSSHYPPSMSAIGVPISVVAETVVHAGHCIVLASEEVEFEELLGFEPYASLGEVLLKELFDKQSQHYNEPLKDKFIYRIARKAYPSMDLFIEMLALDHPDILDNLTEQGRDGAIRRLATAIQLWRGDYFVI